MKAPHFNIHFYDDCLITHEDGSQRIGRIEKRNPNVFALASYQERKCHVVWPVSQVISAVPVIGHGDTK